MLNAALPNPQYRWQIERLRRPSANGTYETSLHALQRMMERSISAEAVKRALTYGRVVYRRGARIFALGNKEVRRYADHGIRLHPHKGIQVVTTTDGVIVTVYRNQDLRGLR